jgi:hypothetical protein
MSTLTPEDSRLTELLADQALVGLSSEEVLELESLLAAGGNETELSLASTAALLELSLLKPQDWQPMPRGAQRRLVKAGRGWAQATSSVLRAPELMDSPSAVMSRGATRLVWKAGPWLVAAACLILSAIAVYNWSPWTQPDIVQVVNRDPEREILRWADWDNPEVKGVMGEAVWCEGRQQGYMRFVNLPANDPAKEQYQLWIVDGRGMGQRISGAIFDADPDGETIVPIQPGIPVKGAKLFAVTIEPPGGTWVSDMSRRVTVASK